MKRPYDYKLRVFILFVEMREDDGSMRARVLFRQIVTVGVYDTL